MNNDIKSGWTINHDEEYAALFRNTGDYTYSGRICGPTPYCCEKQTTYSYEIPLINIEHVGNVGDDGQDMINIAKSKTDVVSCDQEMLVMWFNGRNGNTYYDSVLNNASAFKMKNIDECDHVLTTTDPINMPFITNKPQYFEKSFYVDTGFPCIASGDVCSYDKTCDYVDSESASCSGYSAFVESTSACKYLCGIEYSGHKIKYLPTGQTIPSGCVINNDYLVELYFPHYDGTEFSGPTITGISMSGFCENHNLTAITFSAVEHIGERAFYNCNLLKEIDWGHTPCGLESSCHTIDESAFTNCASIECLILPRSLKVAKNHAFYNCNGVERFDISDTQLSAITEYCFANMTSYSGGVATPQTLQSISAHAFYNCSNMSGFTAALSSHLTEIGEEAFSGCTNMSKVILPESISSFTSNSKAFYDIPSGATVALIYDGVVDGLREAFKSGTTITFYVPSSKLDSYISYYSDTSWNFSEM